MRCSAVSLSSLLLSKRSMFSNVISINSRETFIHTLRIVHHWSHVYLSVGSCVISVVYHHQVCGCAKRREVYKGGKKMTFTGNRRLVAMEAQAHITGLSAIGSSPPCRDSEGSSIASCRASLARWWRALDLFTKLIGARSLLSLLSVTGSLWDVGRCTCRRQVASGRDDEQQREHEVGCYHLDLTPSVTAVVTEQQGAPTRKKKDMRRAPGGPQDDSPRVALHEKDCETAAVQYASLKAKISTLFSKAPTESLLQRSFVMSCAMKVCAFVMKISTEAQQQQQQRKSGGNSVDRLTMDLTSMNGQPPQEQNAQLQQVALEQKQTELLMEAVFPFQPQKQLWDALLQHALSMQALFLCTLLDDGGCASGALDCSSGNVPAGAPSAAAPLPPPWMILCFGLFRKGVSLRIQRTDDSQTSSSKASPVCCSLDVQLTDDGVFVDEHGRIGICGIIVGGQGLKMDGVMPAPDDDGSLFCANVVFVPFREGDLINDFVEPTPRLPVKSEQLPHDEAPLVEQNGEGEQHTTVPKRRRGRPSDDSRDERQRERRRSRWPMSDDDEDDDEGGSRRPTHSNPLSSIDLGDVADPMRRQTRTLRYLLEGRSVSDIFSNGSRKVDSASSRQSNKSAQGGDDESETKRTGFLLEVGPYNDAFEFTSATLRFLMTTASRMLPSISVALSNGGVASSTAAREATSGIVSRIGLTVMLSLHVIATVRRKDVALMMRTSFPEVAWFVVELACRAEATIDDARCASYALSLVEPSHFALPQVYALLAKLRHQMGTSAAGAQSEKVMKNAVPWWPLLRMCLLRHPLIPSVLPHGVWDILKRFEDEVEGEGKQSQRGDAADGLTHRKAFLSLRSAKGGALTRLRSRPTLAAAPQEDIVPGSVVRVITVVESPNVAAAGDRGSSAAATAPHRASTFTQGAGIKRKGTGERDRLFGGKRAVSPRGRSPQPTLVDGDIEVVVPVKRHQSSALDASPAVLKPTSSPLHSVPSSRQDVIGMSSYGNDKEWTLLDDGVVRNDCGDAESVDSPDDRTLAAAVRRLWVQLDASAALMLAEGPFPVAR